MSEKNFDAWNEYKKELDAHRRNLIFRPGEVWFCSIGENIGREQNGKNNLFERPILIIKKFNREMFWGAPLTSKEHSGSWYYNFFYDGILETVILVQLRLVDIGRLQRKLFRINVVHRLAIREKLKNLL